MKVFSNGQRYVAVPHNVTLSPIYSPMATIKCDGRAQFRSEQARDFACLLDLDPEVARWSTAPPLIRNGDEYQLDFVVLTETGSYLIDGGQDEPSPPMWLSSAITSMGIGTDLWR